jgi:two-component system KDP operon response regulator KdpE
MTTVLVADADQRARRVMAAALRFGGYAVETARTLRQAGFLLRRHQPAAVIIDPADDRPAEAIAALRMRTDVPIIVVSDADAAWDKVSLLDAGADDYLAKPFVVEELVARLRAALRRTVGRAEDAPLATAHFTIHLADRRLLRSDGSEARLTPTEWKLVEMLVRRNGRLVGHAELLGGVWGPEAVEKTNYLRVYMASIRRKLEPEPAHPRYFITVTGVGLRFDPEGTDGREPQ